MNFTMELRSRRSKSRTPVTQHVAERQLQNVENHTTVTKTFSTKSSYSIINSGEENESTNSIDKNAQSIEKLQDISHIYDYDEVTSTNSINQNVTNQSLEDFRSSFSSTGSNLSALDLYRAAGEYWNKYPKTDYTYSIHSKDRKELAPGIIAMPNMSRKSLHNSIDYQTNNNKYSEADHTKSNSWLFSSKQQSLFANNVQTRSKQQALTRTSAFQKITTLLKNLLVTVLTFFYVIYTIHNSIFIWFGTKLHKAVSRLMLWDTWLLRTGVSKKNKLNSILALCLIPLLLFGGWWLFYGPGSLLLGSVYNTISNIPVKIQSLPQEKNTISKTTLTGNSATLTPEQIQAISSLLNHEYVRDILSNRRHFADINKEESARELREAISKIQSDLQNLENSRRTELDALAAQLRTENAQKIAHLAYQLNRCCRSSNIQLETHVIKILRSILGAPDTIATPLEISRWLHSAFVAKNDLEMHLNNLTHNLQADYNALIENNEKLIMESVMSKVLTELNDRIHKMQRNELLGQVSIDSLTDEYIKKIVQNTLEIYDADKTGLVDYALESAGGQVLSTRCTESYHARTAVFSVFGIPLWYLGNTPRTVIKPGVIPGECWAFQNFPGFIVIKLVAPIKIEAFSLEHVSKMLAPNGKIDSAPKEFFVYGLKNETDKEPVLLGQYKYDTNGPTLQYFAVQAQGLVFDVVELRIHSNYGNPNYTCLYRFRVHGILSNEPT